METKNHLVLWIVLGALLLVVVVGSVYWWQAEKQTAQNLQEAGLNAVRQEKGEESHKDESTEVLAGTKTYHSDQFSFEVNIPSDWTVQALGSKTELFFNSKAGLQLYFTNVPVSSGLSGTKGTETLNGVKWTTLYNATTGWYYETRHEGKTYVFQPGSRNDKENLEVLSTFKFTAEAENHVD